MPHLCRSIFRRVSAAARLFSTAKTNAFGRSTGHLALSGELPTLTEENADEFQPFEKIDDFQPVNEAEEKRKIYEKLPAEKFYSELSADQDPISIEALPDDTVLILNLAEETEDFSIIDRYFRGRKIDELSTASIKNFVTDDETITTSPPKKFRLRGYDIAFVKGSDEEETRDRLFVVSEEGNQAFAFNLICKKDLQISPSPELPAGVVKKNLELQPVEEFFPMRLYGGKGFAAADGKVYFDFGEQMAGARQTKSFAFYDRRISRNAGFRRQTAELRLASPDARRLSSARNQNRNLQPHGGR